jgi:hypothetical protein
MFGEVGNEAQEVDRGGGDGVFRVYWVWWPMSPNVIRRNIANACVTLFRRVWPNGAIERGCRCGTLARGRLSRA